MHPSGFEKTRPLLLLILAILTLIGFTIANPTILSGANLASMAVFGVELGIIAFGQTLVICGGNTGIDLSVGATMALSQVILGLLLHYGVPWPIAILAALVTGIILGGINAISICRFRISAIIATLATLFAYNGLALVLTGGINIDLTKSSPFFLAIGQSTIFGIPFQLLILYLPLLAIFAYVQHGTSFGRALYLTGTNDRAARLAGVRIARIRGLTYIVTGLTASIAAVINASRLGTAQPDAGAQANLISIAIVVLGGTAIFGGTGSVIGTAMATIVIAIVDYGLSYNNFNPIFQAGVIGVALVTVILVENPIIAWRARTRRARTSKAKSGQHPAN